MKWNSKSADLCVKFIIQNSCKLLEKLENAPWECLKIKSDKSRASQMKCHISVYKTWAYSGAHTNPHHMLH